MRITKLGHACVRVESKGTVLVLDPGAFTEEADATDGATAVLVTHQHPDHWSVEHLRRTDAPVVTIQAVADAIAEADPELAARVRVVRPGERLDDLGLPVEVVGEKHAVIHPDLPHFDNSGFLLDVEGSTLFHPGDALTVPERDVDLLLLPASAPWLKFEELVDYARAVGAPRNVAVHDAIYSEVGHSVLGRQLPGLLRDGATYDRVAAGSEV